MNDKMKQKVFIDTSVIDCCFDTKLEEMKNKKVFDAVKMMRDIRKKHNEKYEKNH
jgi:hypothetical protein